MFAALMRYRGPLSLVLLIGINLGLVSCLLVAAGRTAGAAVIPVWTMRAVAFALGVVLGEVYLLVLWLGLAGPSAAFRYPLAGIVFLFSASTVSRGLGIGQSGDGAILAAYVAVPVLAAHLPLLSLRWLLGWRLAFNAASYPIERAGKTQFYLAHCFWMMTLVALPLALYGALAGMFRTGEEVPVSVLAIIGVLVMLAGAASTWVALATRRRLIPIIVLLAVLCLSRISEQLVNRILITGVVTNYFLLMAPMSGIAATVIVNLALLRAAGLKLFDLRPPT